ncbi:hypothetical protein B0H13DRAFT_2394254 [Mycena leptocephala]|nr:hypothetical protein B0H13DRAFT_2394254 [Mycena leptocephala]
MSGTDAAAADARIDRIKATLASLTKILEKQQHAISPALSLAETAPEPGPGLFTQYSITSGSSAKSGWVFLHTIRSYARLVPEAFIENGELSEEKVVQYTMLFMAKDVAQRWAERQLAKENEQDHALHKLESRAYHMGNWDVFRYTDEFEDLVDLASFEDELVKVTKYRTSLDPAINLTITGSSDPPSLKDYAAWRARTYWQYESHLHAQNARGPDATRVAAPPLPAPVPMDIDHTCTHHVPRRGCFHCGDANHFTRDCLAPANIRTTDVLDKVIRQLRGEMLEKLVACLAMTEALTDEPALEDFPPCDNIPLASTETIDAPPNPDDQPVALAPPPARPVTRLPRKSAWERKLPKRYTVAATSGANSLDLPLEIELTDNAVKLSLNGLINCGATSDFIDSDKASRELAATNRCKQNAALAAELKTYQEQQDVFIAKIADSYGRTQEYMRKLMCSGVHYAGTRAPNLKNVIAHKYPRKAREEGEPSNVHEFDDVLSGEDYQRLREELPDTKKKHLISQLAAHCKVKHHGPRATDKAVQMDTMQTANCINKVLTNLFNCTGISSFMVFTHRHPNNPYIVNSDNTCNFFQDTFKLDT